MNENNTIVLDLTDCKNLWELHERIRVAFDFPEWYGKNWDAFWDLMCTESDAEIVEVVGENTLHKEFSPELELMHTVLSDLKIENAKYGWSFDYKIIS
ncbi:barstar family protein [Clostridium merdae]|uniref:barstar family protein n=1 Tax=Clostridium merdae TaxID=1958780 RepID=UPI000A26F034|nr:barstar family protein [Clostridium merdae]